jgi:hypothetical protein
VLADEGNVRFNVLASRHPSPQPQICVIILQHFVNGDKIMSWVLGNTVKEDSGLKRVTLHCHLLDMFDIQASSLRCSMDGGHGGWEMTMFIKVTQIFVKKKCRFVFHEVEQEVGVCRLEEAQASWVYNTSLGHTASVTEPLPCTIKCLLRKITDFSNFLLRVTFPGEKPQANMLCIVADTLIAH